jgi:hypothetical protein
MISLNNYRNAKEVESLFSKLFEVRQVSHQMHLQTDSYAVHKALNSFYDKLLDLADSLIETFQGQYGIVQKYEIKNTNVSKDEVLNYLEESVKLVLIGHKAFSESDTHLHNIVDEIVALFYSTIYKIKHLK